VKTELMALDLEKSTLDNLVPLKTFPSDPGGEDWLRALEAGSYFVAKPKNRVSDYLLHEFIVLAHTVKTTWLASVSTQQKIRVESLGFSKAHRLIELIAIIDQKVEDGDEQSDRPDPTEGLDDNEKPA
jgi:hypothetical protein